MQENDIKRPSPEELLEIAKQQEASEQKKGKLTIYLGYAPGVGKTYTMLSDAHLRKKEGIDVVVGYAETHGRVETEKLLEGLEVIEPLIVDYKGLKLKEVNFEKIIQRKPQLVIIDELAHTNPPNFKNVKRYQDVEEILNAGIDVYTALNVQHIESLNDLVYQITNIAIKETVPDKFIEQASEIKLVDLTPEELLKRLHEGKVYVRDMAQAAIGKYFRSGNLLALRQIALRIVADSVDGKMRSYMKQHAIAGPWAVKEKVLVGIFASPYAEQLVRATYRFATEIDAQWIAVHVETQKNQYFTDQEKAWLNKAFDLVRSLGGQIVWIKGDDITTEIVNYAKSQNVTKIVIGKPRKFSMFSPTIPEKLITQTEFIDVYLIAPKDKKSQEFLKKKKYGIKNIKDYLYSTINIGAVTLLSLILKNHLNHSSLMSIFLAALVLNALIFEIPAVIVSIVISVLVFDFFFIPPQYTFYISNFNYLISFLVYVVVIVFISVLATKLKTKVNLLKESQLRELSLYELSNNLVMASTKEQVLSILINHIKKLFNVEAAIFIADENNKLKVGAKTKDFEINSETLGIANWSFINKKNAGFGTDTISNATALYIPMITTNGVFGVIAINLKQLNKPVTIDQTVAIDAIAHLGAIALERLKLMRCS
ncbi:two-component system, OmpR family, sensor histidine kinase KdpD [Desulfurella multipotens]|uniref:Two-component system, OmpR family, sensor histidine kinase KdpD n=1 Tax=Desulfurella multipotens TaxID=79269 RepID=A0A1G6HXX7_9BACT|nr:DUF4118 domain-containing protein [Desulfurella multipotens]SDB99159.1 two-component system, OmpR family, sensor histidine kinase KdpD [Desulfurella multipotens]